MSKKLLLALVVLVASAQSAFATCSSDYNGSGHYGCTFLSPVHQKLWGAGATNLGGQTNITYYATPNAPEGAWLHLFPVGLSAQTLHVTLARALPPGVPYYIFMWGYDLDSSLGGGNILTDGKTIFYTIGGGTSNTIILCDRDANGLWTAPATITPTSSSTALDIHLTSNALGDPMYQRTIIMGLWITTTPNVTIDRSGFMENLTLPSDTDDSFTTYNYITNGSFENPIDDQWMWYNSRKDLPVDLRQSTCDGGAHTGTGCLKIPLDATKFYFGGNATQLTSRLFHVIPNRKYTFSVWAKASSGTIGVVVSCKNVYEPPAGFPAQVFMTNSANPGTTWSRVSVSGYFKKYPESDYTCTVSSSALGTGISLYLDDVQFEEGPSPTAYQPSHALDVVLSSPYPGNIYKNGTDTFNAVINAYNGTGSSVTRTLNYEVYNYTLDLVHSGSTSLTVAANTKTTSTLAINPGNLNGDFTVITWQTGIDRSQKEWRFASVPGCGSGVDSTSFLGAHPNFQASTLDQLKKLCYNWMRTLSPGGQGRWELVEAVEGTFTFQDTEIQAALDRNLKVLVTLHSNNPGTPAYGYSGGVPITAKWQAFVTGVVTHYAAMGVKDFEVWNEPQFSAHNYAEIMYTAVNAIHAADASSKAVCFGGMPPSYFDAVVADLAINHPAFNPYTECEAWATHIYVGDNTDPVGAYTSSIRIYNTESGGKDEGSHFGEYSNFQLPGEPFLEFQRFSRYPQAAIKATIDLTTTYARGAGSGLTRYFYYDCRNVEPETFLQAFSCLQKTGNPKAKMIALSIVNSKIDHATSLGNGSPDSGSYFLVFDTGADPIAFMFSSDHVGRQVSVQGGITNGQLQAMDQMGNAFAITATTVPYGRLPVMLKCTCSAATLKAGLLAGVVTTTTDTVAPNIIVAEGPRGDLPAGSRVRLRDVCIDKVSYPNAGEYLTNNFGEPTTQGDLPNPEALQFSYKINAGAWSDWDQTSLLDFSPGALSGSYTFTFRCRDEAGNVSADAVRSFCVGSCSSAAPVPGNSGTIVVSNTTTTSTTLTWTRATSGVTAQGLLQYAVYRSLSNNLATVADVEANGTLIQSYATDIITFNPTGLTPATTYYFNVLVKDGDGTKAAYAPATVLTDSVAPPVPGNLGLLTVSNTTRTATTLTWTRATSAITAQALLQYAVYQSLSNNITTVNQAETNGTLIRSYVADLITFSPTGLTPSTSYYYNVIVKDASGNKAAYAPANVVTDSIPSPSPVGNFLLLIFQSLVQTTVVGNIQGPTGTVATSGYIEFRLSGALSGISYRVAGTGNIVPTTARCSINGSGNVVATDGTSPCKVWGNPTVTPANSCYDVVFAPANRVQSTVRSQLISGTTYNLSSPVFCPIVSVIPQYQTITVSPINSNVVPGVHMAFTLGSASRYFGSGYIDQLFVNNLNGVVATATINAVGANTVQLALQPFSVLSVCSLGLTGTLTYVSDSITAVWGATITGGGANKVLALCNGTAWTVAGK
jgi:hypothetical protein